MAASTRPRLIATDLDGTLLGPDGQVSPVNRAALSRAAEAGVPVVVATGRPARNLAVLDDLPGLHRKVIIGNGAAVYDLDRKTIGHCYPLSPDLAVELAEAIRASVPGASIGFETAEGFLCEPAWPSAGWAANPYVAELPELTSLVGPVFKLLAYHAELGGDELAEQVMTMINGSATVTHSIPSRALVELSAPGVTKASTLAMLCAELGVDARDVVAFGDMPNDAAMLRFAGRGCVVASGHATLLASGLTVVPGNGDDGVGRTVLDLLG